MNTSYPLFVQSADGLWLQPIPYYLSALFGTWAPMIIGAADIALIYLVASRLLKSARLAGVVAAILLTFPAHWIFGLQDVDAVSPVPFALAWLLCLLTFLDLRRPWMLVAGGMCLGAGVYTQPSAPITMAALLAVGGGALWIDGQRSPRTYLALATGFGIPLLLMAPWYAMRPETYQDTMGTWAIHKAYLRFPLEGVRAFFNWNTLSTRVSYYWEIFNPAFWLFRDGNGMFSASAPMLPPIALLALVGVAKLASLTRRPVAFLLLVGLAATPLAASTFGESHALHRALPMVAFLSLLAGLGVQAVVEYLSIRR